MNMLDIQDKLKGLSEPQLVQAMQAPTENVPQFLVLSEITRRKRMRDSMAAQQGNGMTVAQEAVAAAGVPQGGIADMARSMAPRTDMTLNTGVSPVQEMYAGGPVYGAEPQASMSEEFIFDARDPFDVQRMYGGGPVMKMADGQFIDDLGIPYSSPDDIALEEIVVSGPPRMTADEMAAAAEQSAAEAAAARSAAGITESIKPAPPAPQPAARTSAAPSTMGSYEGEIRDAMQRAERRARQDKWMALAQVGLGLMSSTQPTIGGALGEAGLAGLESYRGARDAYEQERLGFAKELSGIESAQASALAAQQAAVKKASAGPSLSDIDSYIESLTTEAKGYDESGNEVTRRIAIDEADRALVAQLEAQRAAMIRNRVAPQM
jgi:hypothetical protein